MGGGDAFASGLIYAMMNDYEPLEMVNFAVASSVIKHTIRGDANITDDVESIRNLMNMNYDIRSFFQFSSNSPFSYTFVEDACSVVTIKGIVG